MIFVCFMNNKYTSKTRGAYTNHFVTEKSYPFMHTSGSNQVFFVNKIKNTKRNVFSKCKNKLRLMF